ncbi:MAG TPA: peptidase domain-containing ABC transporter [Candidatus Angelobacter sp.]|nr:peptidase domain-containing ABC transporter [Candidatus Angelobacter sp.]
MPSEKTPPRAISSLADRFPALRKLWSHGRSRRIPVVRQLAATDCGAAALAMVLGYHGKRVPLDEIRQALGGGRHGTTAAALLRAGHLYGLRGRGVRAEIDDLQSLPVGTVLFWEFSHYVVLERVRRDRVDIVDPAGGRRSVPIDKLRRAFTGVALIFEPTEEFVPGVAKRQKSWALFQQILERRALLARILFTSVVIQVLSAAMPFLTGVLIDRVVPRRDYSLLLILAAGYLVFELFNGVAVFVRAHLFLHLQTHVEASFTLRFLDHLIRLPFAFFQQRTTGDLMMRLSSNSSIKEILTSTTLSTVMDGLMVSLYVILLMLANVALTMMVIGVALVRILLVILMRHKQRDLMAESLEISARSQTYQVEMLSGMETLKAMGLERRAAENWSNLFVDSLNISIKRGRLDAGLSFLQSLFSTGSTLGIMFYGTYLVLGGSFTLGAMMAFSALAAGFFAPLTNLISTGVQLQMLETYLERINDVLDTAPEQADGKVVHAGLLKGAVNLEHVSFRYSKQDPLVLEDMSLAVEPGSRVALVGRTGSGKSTLARLMAGLYEPSSGTLSFDGKNLKHLDLCSVRSQLGIVTQDIQLFGGTMRQNIALADPQMGFDRVIQAAKQACIHDDILSMPMGYETVLADRGVSLSGGQRQRLALARALACCPVILVLDEATSHLDAVTEALVNQNLARMHCTRIVIAHRLSTIQDADLIVVIDGGKIVNQGTHGQLLRASSKYTELLGSQWDREPYVEASADLHKSTR